jgi:Uma2 family endonuclease
MNCWDNRVAETPLIRHYNHMAVPVLTRPVEDPPLDQLLPPELLADGTQGEQRVAYSPVSWNRYLAFDRRLGDDRSGPRLYYLDGELEVLTTSNEHERVKEWVGDLLADYFFETGVEIMPRGQATMRQGLRQAGAEPDKSWCIEREKKFPDLVQEVALTSGGINKLEIYRRFKVPEVWLWRRNKVEVFILGQGGAYERHSRSRLLPGLDLALLERCLAMPSWRQARRSFRAWLANR